MTPQAFVAAWKPAAQDAAAQLGLPWEWVLAQWGLESGYGQSTGTPAASNLAAGNPADLKTSSGSWASFSSPAAFVAAYVAAMRADYGSGWSGLAGAPGAAAVFGAPQQPGRSYYGAQSGQSYGQAVASSLLQLSRITGSDVQVQLSNAETNALAALAAGKAPSTQPAGSYDPWSILPPAGPNLQTQLQVPAGEGLTVAQAASGAPAKAPAKAPAQGSGWLSSLEAWAGHGAALAGTVLLGAVLLIGGLWLAARGAGVKMPQEVKLGVG